MKLSVEELKKYSLAANKEVASMALEIIAIRELKGEQVPVAEIRFAPSMGKHPYMSWFGKQDRDFPVGTQFFTAPQKLVVLPTVRTHDDYESGLGNGDIGPYNHGHLEGWNAAIEAAGGVVKGGE